MQCSVVCGSRIQCHIHKVLEGFPLLCSYRTSLRLATINERQPAIYSERDPESNGYTPHPSKSPRMSASINRPGNPPSIVSWLLGHLGAPTQPCPTARGAKALDKPKRLTQSTTKSAEYIGPAYFDASKRLDLDVDKLEQLDQVLGLVYATSQSEPSLATEADVA